VGQFAKFRAAQCGLPFVGKLSFICSETSVIEDWHCAELCQQHAEIIPIIEFEKCNLSSRIMPIVLHCDSCYCDTQFYAVHFDFFP